MKSAEKLKKNKNVSEEDGTTSDSDSDEASDDDSSNEASVNTERIGESGDKARSKAMVPRHIAAVKESDDNTVGRDLYDTVTAHFNMMWAETHRSFA